ncbi:unnamed protein product, partial [Sphacelaria rigidula]
MFAPSDICRFKLSDFNPMIGVSTQVLDAACSTVNSANCTMSPDCAALGRGNCGTDGSRHDNTCGECLSGYTGVFGLDNSECLQMA